MPNKSNWYLARLDVPWYFFVVYIYFRPYTFDLHKATICHEGLCFVFFRVAA